MEQAESKLVVVTTKSSGMRDASDQARRLIEQGIPLDKLHHNFARFLDGLRQIVSIEQGRVGNFVLDEITFNAEISADGEFKLVGTGVGVSATSGVSFTLRRQSSDKEEQP
jgi:hypothetical protein